MKHWRATFLAFFALVGLAFGQSTTLTVDSTTGAIKGPTSAATFKTGNSLQTKAALPATFTFWNNGDALSTGNTTTPYTFTFAGTITGYSISADAGTATVKFWKKAAGTAIPTVSDSISTSGVSLSSGTHIGSSTVSDFTTTTVTKGDMVTVALTAVDTATKITVTLEVTP